MRSPIGAVPLRRGLPHLVAAQGVAGRSGERRHGHGSEVDGGLDSELDVPSRPKVRDRVCASSETIDRAFDRCPGPGSAWCEGTSRAEAAGRPRRRCDVRSRRWFGPRGRAHHPVRCRSSTVLGIMLFCNEFREHHCPGRVRGSAGSARDVVQMVLDVVQQILAQLHNGEPPAVTAQAVAPPVLDALDDLDGLVGT